MAFDSIELGPVPAEESCAQVGTDTYLYDSARECEVYKRMLTRLFPIPEGLPVSYVVRSHPHDFGTYREVAVRFLGGNQAAADFAYQVEANSPAHWDAIAHYELAWFQRRDGYHKAVKQGSLTPQEIPDPYASNRMPNLDPSATFSDLLTTHPL